MFKGHRSLDFFVMVWAFLVGFLFLCQRGWTLNLHADAPTVYSGPTGSYFGFALDFFQDSKGRQDLIGQRIVDSGIVNITGIGEYKIISFLGQVSRFFFIYVLEIYSQAENFNDIICFCEILNMGLKSKQLFKRLICTHSKTILI